MKVVGIPIEDEHDMGVASRLFPREESIPQVVNIGEELNFLERWRLQRICRLDSSKRENECVN